MEKYSEVLNKEVPRILKKSVKVVGEEFEAMRRLLESMIKDLNEKYTVVSDKLYKVGNEQIAAINASMRNIMEETIPEIISKVEKLIRYEVERISKTRELASIIITKTVETVRDVKDRVSKSKTYIRLIAIIEQRLETLKMQIRQKFEDLMNNPTFVNLKSNTQKFVMDSFADLNRNAEELVEIAQNQLLLTKQKLIGYAEMTKEQVLSIIDQVSKYTEMKVADINDMIKSFVDKIKELEQKITKAVEEFIKQIKSSKAFVDTVDFVERKLVEMKLMLQKLIKDITTNPEIIKITDDIRNFTMTAIKEFKIKAEEFMQTVEKKFMVLKVEVEKLIEIIKKEAPAIARKAIEFIEKQWEKSQEKIEQFVADLEKLFDDLYVKADKFLKELLEELKKVVIKKIEELKKNPSLIKIKEEIKNMTITIINEFKIRIPEMMKNIEAKIVIAEAKFKEYLKLIKEKVPVLIKEATVFVKDTVAKAKAMVESTISELERKVKEIIEGVMKSKSFIQALEFMQKQIALLKEFAKEKIAMIRQKIQDIKNDPNLKKMIVQIKNITITIKSDVEKRAMQIIEIVRKEISSITTKIESSIQVIKEKTIILIESVSAYVKEQIKLVKDFIKEIIESLPEKFKELKEMLMKVVEKIQKMFNELKEKIMKSKIFLQINKYVKKLTSVVKDIVEQIKSMIEKIMNDPTLLALKDRLMKLLNNVAEVINKNIELMKKEIPLIIKSIVKAIKTEIQTIKENIPVLIKKIEKIIMDIFGKSEEFAKITISTLTEVVKSIKESNEFTEALKSIKEAQLFANENLKNLMNDPSFVSIRGKVSNMIMMTRNSTVEYVDILAEELPKMSAEVKDLVQFTYTASKTVIEKLVTALEKKYTEILDAVTSSDAYITLSAEFSRLATMVGDKLEEVKQMVENKMKDLEKITKKTFADLKESTDELQEDIILSYQLNKNVTVHLYDNLKTIVQPYYSNAIESYNQLIQRLKNTYDNSNTYEEIYGRFVQIYEDLSSSNLQELYNSLKKIIIDFYNAMKPSVQQMIQKGLELLLQAMIQVEETTVELGKSLQSSITSIQQASMDIMSGENATDVLASLNKELLGKINIQTAQTNLCEKQQKLCSLVRESVDAHKRLATKYLAKI